MKVQPRKTFTVAALACCFFVFGAVAASGQVPDIPGSVGSPGRPDRSAAEDAAARREARERRGRDDSSLTLSSRSLSLALEDVNDQFAEYSAIDKVLGVSIDALREEYNEEKQEIPVLQPKHLFTAKLLVRSANRVRPGKVTKRSLLDKMQDGVRPAAYFQSRGFSEAEVRAIFSDVEKTLAQIRKDSQR